MTTDDTPSPENKRVLDTLSLRFAAAFAEAEAELMEMKREAEVLRFTPRAAFDGQAVLPRRLEAENDDSISVAFEDRGDTILVQVETSGFYRVDEVEGRSALLKTNDNTVRYQFTFDEDGMGVFSIANRPDVVAALAAGVVIFIRSTP